MILEGVMSGGHRIRKENNNSMPFIWFILSQVAQQVSNQGQVGKSCKAYRTQLVWGITGSSCFCVPRWFIGILAQTTFHGALRRADFEDVSRLQLLLAPILSCANARYFNLEWSECGSVPVHSAVFYFGNVSSIPVPNLWGVISLSPIRLKWN